VEVLKAPAGETVPLTSIESTLRKHHFHAITITHVDTSTGTLADVETIANMVHEVSQKPSSWWMAFAPPVELNRSLISGY